MTQSQQAIYRAWAKTELSLPVWHQPWWLDATAGQESWDAAIATRGSEVLAALPYVKRTRLGLTILNQPPLTQSLGPWFSGGLPPSLSLQHRLLEELLEALPPAAAYEQNWMPEAANWLPFYWAGYRQTTRYSYRISLEQSEDSIWRGFDSRCRGTVRKAAKTEGLTLVSTRSVEDFWPLVEEVYARQDLCVPFGKDLLIRIVSSEGFVSSGSLLLGLDDSGTPSAGAVTVYDSQRAYYIVGGVSTAALKSGAMSAVLWEAIKRARDHGLSIFDFEGSMIRPIETFFRSFGAVQTPYFRVWRYGNPLLRAGMSMRGR